MCGAGLHVNIVNITGGKVGILKLSDKFAAKAWMWNFLNDLINLFSICALFVAGWLEEAMALKKLSSSLFLSIAAVLFQSWQKVKVHWKEWFNEKDDVEKFYYLHQPLFSLIGWDLVSF